MSPVRSADSVYRVSRRMVRTVQGIRNAVGLSHKDDILLFKRIAGYLDRNGSIRREDGPAVAKRITEIRGVSASLTPENIEGLFEQGALIGKFLPGEPYSKMLGRVSESMRDLAIKSSVKPTDITPEFVEKVIRSSNLSRMLEDLSKGDSYKAQSKLLNDLAAATDVRSVLEVNVDSIISMDICSGARVYVREVATGKIKQEVSKGIVRQSIYADNFLMPRGEKRQYIFRLGEARRLLESAKNAMAKNAFKALFKSLVIWHIPNREEWPEYGMNRQIVEKLRKALKHESDRFLGKFKGLDDLSQALAKELFEKGEQSLCLMDSMITEDGRRIFEEFVTRMNASMEQRTHLEAVLESALSEIRGAAARFREDITKSPRDLRESSARANNQVFSEAIKIASDWAAKNHMPVQLSPENFPFVICNFIEALKEFEEEVKELKCHPDCIRDRLLLGLIGQEIGREYRVLAIVLANNDAENIALSANKERKDWSPRPIFESEERKEEVVRFLSEINDAVAKALVHEKNVQQIAVTSAELEREKANLQIKNVELEVAGKASRLDASRQIKLRELTDSLFKADDQSPIESRYQKIVEKIFEIMRTNGESFNVSMTRTIPNNLGLMDIVANTKKDENGNLVLGNTTRGIMTDWVVRGRNDVFIFGGKVFINGVEQSKEDFESLRTAEPKFCDEIERILKQGGTSGLAAIKLSDQVWVLNLTDAKLDIKTMDIFREIANILSGGLRNSILNREIREQNVRLQETIAQKDQLFETLRSMNERLEEMIRFDGLTRVMRRETIFKELPEDVEKARRNNMDMAVMMVDVDWFKKVNDLYGHEVGDIVLAAVAQCLQNELGADGKVGRYGGEEFLSWMPLYSKLMANERWGRIIEKMANMPIDIGNGQKIKVTISVGIASLKEDYDAADKAALRKLINGADDAMYVAKADGRNQRYMINKDVSAKVAIIREKAKEKEEALRRFEEREAHRASKISAARKVLAAMKAACEQNDIEKAKSLQQEADALLAEAEII